MYTFTANPCNAIQPEISGHKLHLWHDPSVARLLNMGSGSLLSQVKQK